MEDAGIPGPVTRGVAPWHTRAMSESSRPVRLRFPEHRVSRRAMVMWVTQAAAVWLVLVVAQLVAPAFGGPGWLLVTAGICAVLGAAHSTVMPWWRYRVHRWETTSEAVYTVDGWFDQEWRAAPISRIQTVDTRRGPLHRLFGLSAVTVTTASAAGSLVVNGLEAGVAARLAGELTRLTQDTPGDAT